MQVAQLAEAYHKKSKRALLLSQFGFCAPAVCVENAGRSQMAEAFANRYGKDKFIVSSAGNKPADKVNPIVVEALREIGIEISMNKPKLLTFQMVQDADLIVTMGCNDARAQAIVNTIHRVFSFQFL